MSTKQKKNDTQFPRLRTIEEIDAMPGTEIPEKRTAMGKVYSLGEDIYQAVLYAQPVHYLDKKTGTWQEIDGELDERPEGSATALQSRGNGSLRAKMRGASEDWMVSLENEAGDTLSWRMEDTREKGKSARAASWKRDIQPRKRERPALSRRGGKRAAERFEKAEQAQPGQAVYEGILPDTDLYCGVNGDVFKEDIVFRTKEAVQPIAFVLSAPGLSLAQGERGIAATDTKGGEAFLLTPPFMQDAQGALGPVDVSLQADGDTWRMVYTPDAAWVETAELPITLDPVVMTLRNNAPGRYFSCVNSKYPDKVYANAGSVYVSDKYTTQGDQKAFLHYDISLFPTIDPSYVITSAKLNAPSLTYSNSVLYAQEVLSAYDPSTLTYNTMPTVGTVDLDSFRVWMSTSEGWQYANTWLDVTRLVHKWYAGDNKGLCLSTRSPDSASRTITIQNPYLVLTYVSKAGLEKHLKYESFSAGRAGTASVNLFNGNLVLTHADTASSGSRLPVNVTHYYNTCNSGLNIYKAGNGWRHSLQETMHKEMLNLESTTSKATVYVHTRGDGSRAYYQGSILNSDGVDLSGTFMRFRLTTVRVNNVNIKVAHLTDRGDNILEFDQPIDESNGKDANFKALRSLTDAQGNVVTVTSTAPDKITKATDGAGRDTTFGYNASGMLTSIKGPGNTRGLTYAYNTKGELTAITHEDGLITTYAYNTNGLLSKVTNHDGLTLDITYTSTQPYRVAKIAEKNGTTVGNSRSYTYTPGMTVVKDLTVTNGKSIRYHFNGNGNVVAAHDELGHASVTRYQKDYPANHPESISRMQRAVVNLLKNHRCEKDEAWASSGGGYATGDAYIGTRCMRIQNPEDAVERYIRQGVTLVPGRTYTYSCFLKRTGEMDVWMAHAYKDSAGKTVVERGPSIKADTSIAGKFHRVSYSFTLPATAAAAVSVYVYTKGTAGTASTLLLDAAQLEEGPVANRYNLLVNGDFAFDSGAVPGGWVAQTANTTADKVRTDIGQGKPAGLSVNTLRLNGGNNKKTGIYQEIDIAGKRNDIFVLGGWAKTLTAQHRDKKYDCSLRVSFKRVATSTTFTDNTEDIKWSEEWTDWQFAAGPILAPADYYAMRVYISYEDNINYGDFAGIFLHREEFGWSYVYDGNGKVLSVRDLSGQYRRATYDADGNMLTYQHWGTSNDRVTMNYGTAPKKHLLQYMHTPLYVRTEYTYDTSGNQTQAKVRGTSVKPFMQSQTTYTADMNHVATKTDTRGKQMQVVTDPQRDTLTSATDPMGQAITYEYDQTRRLTKATAVVGTKTYQNTYTYTADRLTEARHNTTADAARDVVFTFAHDALGNPTEVKVGTDLLSKTVYTTTGDKLPTATEYGNGGKVRYTYDAFKRLTGISHDTDAAPRYTYDYDAGGNVAQVQDKNLNRVKTCEFDMSGRPMRVKEKQGHEVLFTTEATYDDANRVSVQSEKIGNAPGFETAFTYDRDNRISKLSYQREGEENAALGIVYDGLGRVTTRNLTAGASTYAQTFGYFAGGHGTDSTTSLIQTITQPGQNLTYTYDDAGRIKSEKRNTRTTGYYYDKLGQLVRVNDPLQNLTQTFTYDQGGNITSKKSYPYTTGAASTYPDPLETIKYVYGYAAWRDKLTTYNGVAITYDRIGNPVSDGTWAYTWGAGTQLRKLEKPGETITFDYDAGGKRVRKTSTSQGTTEYTMMGDKLVHLNRRSVDMHFWYNDLGKPQVAWYNCDSYYYVYNQQGDVIALVNSRTNQEAVAYAYDAWGKQISCTGAMAATLGVENPFRYRGYIYDEETGWYYLMSRYYRPEWGRFISADGVIGRKGKVLDHNLFAYCRNNPVSFADPDGNSPLGMAGAMTGNPLLFLAGMALAALVSIALPKPISNPKPKFMVIQGGASSPNDPKPTPNPGPGPVIAEVVNTAKPEEEEKEPILFPVDPADFHPRGLVIGTWQTPNGLILKWSEPSKKEIFEWNEDHKYGPHYHIRELSGYHYQPGTPIPEPYATIYFR